MSENYDKLINEEYSTILTAIPHHAELRKIVAKKIANYAADKQLSHPKMLEFGSGRGETLVEIFREFDVRGLSTPRTISVDFDSRALEEQKMIVTKEFPSVQVEYICADIIPIMENFSQASLDICTATWTLHNFNNTERVYLLKLIRAAMRPDGIFVVMDKYVPDDPTTEKQLYDNQVALFSKLPIKKENLKSLLIHEAKDRSEAYIMREKESMTAMHECGFEAVSISDRKLRDAICIASPLAGRA